MKISVVIWRLVFLIVFIEILGLLFYNFWHPADQPATPAIKEQNSPMTNIISFLYTTTAYKTAAWRLMVGQASFAAKQLDLKEPLPIVMLADKNKREVMPPPMGIGGMILISNYNFEFDKGYLIGVGKIKWLEKNSPPITSILELTNEPSLLDTNSAYQLATQWLEKISVNVPKMEQKYPPRVFQVSARQRDSNGNMVPGNSNAAVLPLFLIGWGDPSAGFLRTNRQSQALPLRRPSGMDAVFVEILGTTRELLALHIRDTDFFMPPPLTLTNAAGLLGPLPPPRHFVEELLGGKEAYETVAAPDKVEAWLLNTDEDQRDKGLPPERAGPKKLGAGIFGTGIDKTFSGILLDFNSYAWGEMKLCSPDFGLRLRFTRGKDVVVFQLCYECDILEVSHHGRTQQENFDFAHNKLVKAVQNAFPQDEFMRKLELNNADEQHKEYEEIWKSK